MLLRRCRHCAWEEAACCAAAAVAAHPEPTLAAAEIWAPELQQVNGRWYIYATALRDLSKGLGPGSDQFVLESVNASSPLGPYR